MKKYVTVNFKKLTENAKVFEYMTEGAACADVYSNKTVILPPFVPTIVPTGIAVELPKDYELQIRARSGQSLKGTMVSNGIGTIDSDYRGEIGVILTNITSVPITITEGSRIAQTLIAPVIKAIFVEVEELSSTDRNKGGFGSTGTK